MATPNIVPRADSEGALGTATKYWGAAYIDLIYLGAGKIGRDADNLIDFSVDNNIVFKVNGVSELQLNATEFFPYASNGLSLGNSGRMWSDLFLASGAVINFDNGNVTLTHSSNALTLADGDKMQFGAGSDLQVFHDGTNSHIDNYVGAFSIIQRAADGALSLQCDDSSGGVTPYITLDGNVGYTIASKPIRFLDSVAAQFGTGLDMQVYHTGSAGKFENLTGDITFENQADDGDIIFKSDNGSGGTTTYFALDGGSVQTKFHKNTEHQDSVLGGYGNGMDLQLQHNATDSYIDNYTGDLYFRDFADDKDIVFQSDNGAGGVATYFYLDGSSATHDGSATTSLFTNWPDKSRITLGTSHDLQVFHDGSNTYFENYTGDVTIANYADDKDIKFFSDDGSGGVAEYFRIDGGTTSIIASKNLELLDDVELKIGTGNDLNIRHNGDNSFIQSQNGDLTISNSANDKDIILMSDDGSGGVTSYIQLDGSAVRTKFNISTFHPDGIAARFGNGEDLKIYHNGTGSFVENEVGNLTIFNKHDDGDIIFATDNGSGGTTTYMDINGGDEYIYVYKQFNVRDNVLLTIGNSNDLQIYHDASNSYIKDTGTGDLRIMAGNAIQFYDAGTAETLAKFNSNGSVDLYHNNVKTFETTATGVQIGASSSAKANPLSINHAPTAIASLTTSNNGTAWNTSSAIMLEGASNSNGLGFGVSSTANDRKSYIQSGHPAQSAASSLGTLLLNPLGGSVGIGTISPASLLHVAGTVQVGVDDTGHDVKFFGATSGKFLQWDESADTLFLTDNTNITFGNGNDATIGVASDNLVIKNDTADKDIIFQSDDGSGGVATYFFLDGSQANTSFQKDIIFGDGKKALFGGGGDLQIYHDGSNSYIKEGGTGGLKILAADFNLNVAADNASMIRAIDGGTVELYFGGAKKLETTATGISVTGATGTAEGGGIDATDAVSIKVGEVNGEIITTIFVDIGIGSIQSSSTNTGAIGNGTDAAAYITRVTTAINGIVYKVELICVEAPTVASGALSADIDLTANSSSIASGSAVSGSPICNSAGDHALGRFVRSADSTTNTITPDDYLYLAQGTTNAGVYNAGKFLIRLFGAKTTGL